LRNLSVRTFPRRGGLATAGEDGACGAGGAGTISCGFLASLGAGLRTGARTLQALFRHEIDREARWHGHGRPITTRRLVGLVLKMVLNATPG